MRTRAEAEAARDLARAFVAWLKARYPEMAEEIDAYLLEQRFEEQIDDVLANFSPPEGECLLARHEGEPVGILMLKDTGDGSCEMNRMFVLETARGLGIGRALVERLKVRATEMGFRTMTLSALYRHHEALPLYRSAGFEPYEPPSGPERGVIHMRLDLGSA